jgi:hypothetical protein
LPLEPKAVPFFVRFGQRDYPLPQGKFVIGRSEDAQLCLDDPLASRHHAVIVLVGDTLSLEDLGSRNGVFLNRERVASKLVIKHGDAIQIGSQEMTIVQKRSARAETLARFEETSAAHAAGSIAPFGMLGAVADKALALGHGEDAERILGRQLEQLLERGAGALDPAVFSQSVHYALKIATLTKKAKWIDFVLRLHARGPVLMDLDVVNQLYFLCPKVAGVSRPLLREYVALLSAKVATFAPSERFVLSRLEGLEKQL